MKRIAVTVLVAIHLVVSLWHGKAHTVLAVALTPAQNAFVILVILIAPLIASLLIWTRHVLPGAWIFFLSMLGALLFGAYYHFVEVSPDHIGHLPAGSAHAHSTFIATAAMLAALELASALYGAFYLRSLLGASARIHGKGKA
jgi:hypothetical protein